MKKYSILIALVFLLPSPSAKADINVFVALQELGYKVEAKKADLESSMIADTKDKIQNSAKKFNEKVSINSLQQDFKEKLPEKPKVPATLLKGASALNDTKGQAASAAGGSQEQENAEASFSAEGITDAFAVDYLNSHDNIGVSKEKEMQYQDILRNSVANLYAVSFVMRDNLLEEKNNKKSPEFTTTEENVKAVIGMSAVTAARLSRIKELEAQIAKFKLLHLFRNTADFASNENLKTEVK